MPNRSEFSKGYNSFSGVDIKGVFANQVIAELQAISYSISREKAPIYTMGSADPRSFSRGKRGIAGTLIFIVFDRHALLGAFGQYQPNQAQQLWFLSDIDDVRPGADVTKDINSLSLGVDALSSATVGANIGGQESPLIASIDEDQVPAAPWYADQIPPFDITLAAANEYGSLAVMRLFGIELLNEGYGVSIDDVVSEMQHSYVARSVVGWQSVGTVNLTEKPSSGSV